jgi:hypothetical protein
MKLALQRVSRFKSISSLIKKFDSLLCDNESLNQQQVYRQRRYFCLRQQLTLSFGLIYLKQTVINKITFISSNNISIIHVGCFKG